MLDAAVKSVELSASMKATGKYAFIDCPKLTDITIPDSVETISYETFLCCDSLDNVVLPSSVKTIEDLAFEKCISLTNIVIPDSVTSIGNSAFLDTPKLNTIYYTGTEEQWKQINIGNYNESLLGCKIVFEYNEPRVSLALDGSLKVLILFSNDIIDGWTLNDKKFTTTNKIATYEVAAKDFMKDIVLAKNGKTVVTFKVADILKKYKEISSISNLAKALEAYCKAASAYFDDKATVADFSSSWEEIKLATKSSTLSDKTAALGDNYYGSSLLLRSSTILRHYFTNEKSDLSYEQKSIPAHLYADKENYCVNDYIYKVLTNSKSTADLKNVCAALYYYGVEAAEYYDKLNS